MKTWQRVSATSALMMLTAAMVATPALAASTSTADAKNKQAVIGNQIGELQDQVSEATADEADLLTRLNDLHAKKADLDTQTADLQGQISAAQADHDDAQVHLDAVNAQQLAAQASLATAQVQLQASSDQLEAQAIDAYTGGQTARNLSHFILKAEDMRKASAVTEYLNQIVDDRRVVVEQHRQLEAQAKDLTNQIATARAEAMTARDVIASRQAQLDSQRIQLESLQSQAADDAAAQAALLDEIEQKKGAINAQIDSLQKESDDIAEMLRQADKTSPKTAPAPPPSHGIIANPVPGAIMTSPFGMRVNPVTGIYTLHAGQDFGVAVGTPIHAAADGTVVSAGVVSGYGNYTCLSHGGGLATCYAHQSQFLVTAGQHVTRNQVIGLSGNTGNSTGPHLHFEVRINGTPVNPLGYL